MKMRQIPKIQCVDLSYCVKQNTMSKFGFDIHLFNFLLLTCCSRIMLHSV